jgi:hypothetical protein
MSWSCLRLRRKPDNGIVDESHKGRQPSTVVPKQLIGDKQLSFSLALALALAGTVMFIFFAAFLLPGKVFVISSDGRS